MALILGIQGFGWHNAGVCLVDSEREEILFASEEERFDNIKHSDHFPAG